MAGIEDIGDRIQMARTARGLSQRALAERSGIGKDQIGLYEAGRRQPREARIAELARTLQVGAHWLATGDGSAPTGEFPDDDRLARVEAKLDRVLELLDRASASSRDAAFDRLVERVEDAASTTVRDVPRGRAK